MIAADYLEIGAAGWRWVLDQVGWDDGPWIPETTADAGIPEWRDGMHSGTAGLAPALAEIRLARGWTDEEQALADGIVDRIRRRTATETDVSYFLGLTSGIGALGALGALGAETTDSLARIRELATPDGWSQDIFGPPRNRAGAPVNDVVIGAAGVALGAIWAGGALGNEVAGLAADVLMGRAEQLPTGPNWPMISPADLIGSRTDLPNFSHGTAGVATALALVGEVLGRDDLVEAARLGAEHLVTLGNTRGGGFAVPHYLPHGDSDEDEVTYTWCHGPTGTSLLFLALDMAGVRDVAGEPPLAWHARCLHSVRTSGVPERLHPGFWDNDGRCCGTAGVGDVFLDSYQRSGDPADLQFAVLMANALVERAYVDGNRAWWRFIEHRNPEPLLPPGVGWLQGSAGIATFLMRIGRVLEQGVAASAVARMDNWWALPAADGIRPRPQPRE